MKKGSTIIDDTFAEAFRMRFARIVVTAADRYWVETAVRELTSYGTSIIACDAEAGIEKLLAPSETPDGRPGAAALLFGFSAAGVGKALVDRAGQCVMTCATTAAYDGLPEAAERLALGKHLRFFGDGFQKSKVLGGRRYWRIPVMDGEFLVEDTAGVAKGIAGGNIIVQGTTPEAALAATRRAVDAVADLSGLITPFPGGIVRSGSKVGSRYKALKASTNDEFCPGLRSRTKESRLHPDATCAYEIVFDGVDDEAIRNGMRVAIEAAAGSDVPMISAGNYGGKLGKFLYPLRELLS